MSVVQRISFAGKVIETTVTDKASVADAWLLDVRSSFIDGQRVIVGLDFEWRPHPIRSMSNKTAVLQLCIDTKCLILQLFYIDYIPQSIKNFFNDPNVTFVGVEVEDDIMKLRNEYGIRCTSGSSDIRAVTIEHWPNRYYRRPGLKDLARDVVGLYMPKPRHVCLSNWDTRVLDEDQIEYACIDAYASYRIGHKLLIEI